MDGRSLSRKVKDEPWRRTIHAVNMCALSEALEDVADGVLPIWRSSIWLLPTLALVDEEHDRR